MERLVRKDLVIYLDMDNVLVQFSNKENEEYQLERMYDKGFYLNLDSAIGAYSVVSAIREMKIPVKIISGLIDSPYVKEEKIIWCKEHLLVDPNDIILLPMEESKAGYVSNLDRNKILVDDYPRYIEEWNGKGGTGIVCSRKEYKKGIYISEIRDILAFIVSNIDDISYNEKCGMLDSYFTIKERGW